MIPSTFSERIKRTNSTNKDVTDITEKLNTSLNLADEPTDNQDTTEENVGPEEEEWERLADEVLKSPPEPVKAAKSPAQSNTILELYDCDPRIQMHQLVKELAKIIDPTGTMSFRPKMINQSLMLTFTSPNHATTALYNYSCTTPQNPLGKLRRSDGTPISRSSSTSSLPPALPGPSRIRPTPPSSSSRPLTTDSVARRFIAGHLGIRTTSSPERKEYDKLVRRQAQQEKEEREKRKRLEEESVKRQEEELRDIWEHG